MIMAEPSAGHSSLIRPALSSPLKRSPLDDTLTKPDKKPRQETIVKPEDRLQDIVEVEAAPPVEHLGASTAAEPTPGENCNDN
jgi:hypothetical protein